ncbi:hypothetical protein BCR34DRAFT_90945 [Clohesyomyces aquaticus]|uniref:Uncharacterized protein n=1 Tax=Clohesyomyces aquaticus TaxID=1231657 RepID=A0A1Y1YUL7_9PLEO|nr:hypothetical protein BCR34DRAFT_90945 [Clohesyomyces aquaticus]
MNLRHGSDMRKIPIVTLVFLPGTFVATHFSASFWNFQPDNKGSVVSPWVWLYWVITLALTLLVLSAWQGREFLMFTQQKLAQQRLRGMHTAAWWSCC